MRWIESILGACIMVTTLIDVFLVVLYARMGAAVFSKPFARAIWKCFVWGAEPFHSKRAVVLSFCGPVILVLLVGNWVLDLVIGAALVVHPNLGSAIHASQGPTPTDFLTAVYIAGATVATVGPSDFPAATTGMRLFYLINSLLGFSVVSLTVTYLMQVYGALQRRNTLGLKMYLLTRKTGDAAEAIAGIAPEGDFERASNILTDVAAEITNSKESHHFYPVLFYFQFEEPFYSVSMFALEALDMVTLIRSLLPQEQYRRIKEASEVSDIWDASLMLVTTLEETFVPQTGAQDPRRPDPVEEQQWRQRFYAAQHRLEEAGIRTRQDVDAVEEYVSLRSHWHWDIVNLSSRMGYRMNEIDPACSKAPQPAPALAG